MQISPRMSDLLCYSDPTKKIETSLLPCLYLLRQLNKLDKVHDVVVKDENKITRECTLCLIWDGTRYDEDKSESKSQTGCKLNKERT